MPVDDAGSRPEQPRGPMAEAFADEFSVSETVGGWRGVVESSAPGLAFVIAFVIDGGFQVPVISAVATMAVLIAIRLVQRQPIRQALSGAVGVAIGAAWAYFVGEPEGFYVPGLYINAAYAVGIAISMIVGWPVVGVVWGLVTGHGSVWRDDRSTRRRMQGASAVLLSLFVLKLAVQVPLYLADQVAALGAARLLMGLPLYALTLWVVWAMVRDAGPRQDPEDPPPSPR